VSALALPGWYLGAGCIAQTVWNLAHSKPPGVGILDYDLVYFDPDLSESHEDDVRAEARALTADQPIDLDVKNQARVHLWYSDRFGYEIKPYSSIEEAIASWPTTATAVGVRLLERELDVYAPFGLEDLVNLTVRANRVQITPEIYDKKVARWIGLWPRLTVLPWDQGVGSVGERCLVQR
jgi:uncharacterized protein